MSGRPKSCYHVRYRRNSRSPKGREPHGDGVPIVVRVRESRTHGEAGQVTLTARTWRYSSEKRRNDTRHHPKIVARTVKQLEGVYRQLFNPELYSRAYGRLYRNAGAMTPGATEETVDGMSNEKILGHH